MLQMLGGGRNSPFRPWNALDSQRGNTVLDFQFPNISPDTLHLYIKSFPARNSKGQILTLISNNFLCFNCLSYEIVQHKLNQELTNKHNFKKIFTILELKEHGKWFYWQNLHSYAGCSLGIGDRRILRLLRRILWLNFDGLELSYIFLLFRRGTIM